MPFPRMGLGCATISDAEPSGGSAGMPTSKLAGKLAGKLVSKLVGKPASKPASKPA